MCCVARRETDASIKRRIASLSEAIEKCGTLVAPDQDLLFKLGLSRDCLVEELKARQQARRDKRKGV